MPLNDNAVRNLIAARNNYDYPAAKMEFDANGEFVIADGIRAKFVEPANDEKTGNNLDQYHNRLLRSDSHHDRLLGMCSVIYWGFYTFSDNYARVRVRRFTQGHGRLPPTTSGIAYEKMSQIITSCNDSEHGAALGSLNGVSQLQRTPFASKIIAFVDPNKAGIYDNRIGNALASSATDSHLAGGVGNVSSGSVKGIYNQWCEHLSEIAEFLNEGIESGKSWRWIENESGEQDWRALDVERAYFSLAA